MSVVRMSNPTVSACENCHAPLSALMVGGVGTWQRTILCRSCLHVKRNVPLSNIWELVAEKYGISYEAARLADERSQTEYERIILGGEPFNDIPAVTGCTRYTARRRQAAGRSDFS